MDYKHIPVPTDLENGRNTLELLLKELAYQVEKASSIPGTLIKNALSLRAQDDVMDNLGQEVFDRTAARCKIQNEILRRFHELGVKLEEEKLLTKIYARKKVTIATCH